MSMLDEIQLDLIRRLAPGDWVSGAELAGELGLSREAISRRIRRLDDFGLDVARRSGRGYRLGRALELLDARQIVSGLDRPVPVEVLGTTDSTNAWVAARPRAPLLCLAEHQSAGRGRRGRSWSSPFGQNLYLSLGWELPQWPEKLSALGLVLGVVLAEALRERGVPAQLKWPNDLYLNGRKCGGLLIEQRGEAQGACQLVIGLGLNVAMRAQTDIDQPWTSLAREGFTHSRNALAIALTNAMSTTLDGLDNARISGTLARFQELDLYHGQPVSLQEGATLIRGRSAGLDDWGRLQLETDAGLQHYSVGDVSLRSDG